MTDLLRVYETVGRDGYPPEWHREIKHLIREQAGHRCLRCGHPYRIGEHGNGEWSPCDEHCTHHGEVRVTQDGKLVGSYNGNCENVVEVWEGVDRAIVEARWRVLTVHHISGAKNDCRWWNLVALCQRCHLTIQGKVNLAQTWPWPHSDWFKPYAAGFYACAYLGEDLTREETLARLDELLALELSTPA